MNIMIERIVKKPRDRKGRSLKGRYQLATALAALCALPAGARAQTAPSEGTPSAPTKPADDVSPADIIVTALRRSQQLQDVPLTLSAVTGDALQAQGVTSLVGVAAQTPGVFLGTAGNARPVLYIRGIGTRQVDPGSESSIGVFVDEIYQGRISGLLGSLKDVDRIEILKGPQGTLYGRNTIGGAINILTNDPTPRFEGYGELTVGNYGNIDATAVASGPLSDDLLARAVIYTTQKDGYFRNLATRGAEFGTDRFGGRLKLVATPTDRLKLSLLAEYSDDAGSGSGAKLFVIPGATTPPSVIFAAPGRVPQLVPDRYATIASIDGKIERQVFRGSLKGELDLGALTAVSLTSYTDSSLFELRDLDGTSLRASDQLSNEKTSAFTQEIRLVSNPGGGASFDGKLDWIVGAFYYNDRSRRSDVQRFGADSIVTFLTRQNRTAESRVRFRSESFAAFADLTWHFDDRFALSVGGRYTVDHREAAFDTRGDGIVIQTFAIPNRGRTWRSFDPKATLSIAWTPDILTYATVSTGFKSGAFQFLAGTAAVAGQIADPEEIVHYEAGLKSQLFDRRMTFNLSVFHDDFNNIQLGRNIVLSDGSIAAVNQNSGKTRITGGEATIAIDPGGGFRFDLGYQYLPVAKYLDYNDRLSVPPRDYSDTRMVRAPKHTINLGADYRVDLDDDTQLTLHGDYNYRSDFFHEPGAGGAQFGRFIPFTREQGYGLLNANIGLAYRNKSITAFVRNATNSYYRQTVQAIGNIQLLNFYGEPRTYGLTLRITQ